MKPKNFPGRKNARRIRALDRLPGNRRGEKEGMTLMDRILPEAIARAVRTKKDRSSRARVRQ